MIMLLLLGRSLRVSKSFFCAAVRALVRAFIDYPLPGSRGRDTSFGCSPIRPNSLDTTTSTGRDTPTDQPGGIPVMSLPPPLTFVTFLGIIFGCSLMRPSTTPG